MTLVLSTGEPAHIHGRKHPVTIVRFDQDDRIHCLTASGKEKEFHLDQFELRLSDTESDNDGVTNEPESESEVEIVSSTRKKSRSGSFLLLEKKPAAVASSDEEETEEVDDATERLERTGGADDVFKMIDAVLNRSLTTDKKRKQMK